MAGKPHDIMASRKQSPVACQGMIWDEVGCGQRAPHEASRVTRTRGTPQTRPGTQPRVTLTTPILSYLLYVIICDY